MNRLMVMAAVLLTLTACTPPVHTPADAICDGLRPALPTWSRQDTERSKIEGARFLDVWHAVCEPP